VNPHPAIALSFVVPFFNEEGCARAVVTELRAELDRCGLAWECLLVDDGSTDGTAAELGAGTAGDPRCRVIRLPVNCGQGAALLAGFQAAQGALIGMMDGDGQNVPGDLPALLARLPEADVVVGIRAGRHDSLLRKACSRVANAVRRRFLHDQVSDAGCALKVFRREVMTGFFPVNMLNPFIPAFAAAAGFRIAELPVRHRPRTSGRSKYGLGVILWRPMCDMLALWWMLRRRIPVEKLGAGPGQPPRV
jgi:dolichol-phosphate mannosyltransferase